MVATRLYKYLPRLLWLAIVLQVGVVFYKSQPHLTNDSPTYLELARQLDAGAYGTGSDDGFRPEAARPPGYPIFLWLFLHGLGLPWAAVIIVQYGLYLLAVYLTQALLVKHGFSTLPLLLLVLAYPFPATYAARVMPEGLTLFLVTLLAYLLARPAGLKASTAMWAGAVVGVAILVRPNLALLPAGLALFFFWASYRGGGVFVAPKRVGLMLLVTGLVLAPYAIRNYVVFGMPTPLPPAGPLGHSLYLATWEGELTHADQEAFILGRVTEAARNSGFASEVARLNESMGAPPMTAPYSPDYYDSPYHNAHLPAGGAGSNRRRARRQFQAGSQEMVATLEHRRIPGDGPAVGAGLLEDSLGRDLCAGAGRNRLHPVRAERLCSKVAVSDPALLPAGARLAPY
jgi:hypothetical protein